MGLLEGKNALIFGLANDKSIAWGITQAFKREGANIGISYAGEMLEKRVKPLAEQVDCKWLEECDITKDEHISATVEKAAKHFGKIDVLVHSIAFAGRDELSRPFHETSREGFKNALEISAFSLVALAHAFLPIMNPGASVMCLTYYGSVKVVPFYNVMGVAKAALEASTRYLAYDLGPKKFASMRFQRVRSALWQRPGWAGSVICTNTSQRWLPCAKMSRSKMWVTRLFSLLLIYPHTLLVKFYMSILVSIL